MKIGKLSLYQQFKQFRRNIGPSTFIETPEYIMWSNLMILIWFRIPVVVERVSYWKFRPQVSKRFVILETTSLLQVQRKISMVQSAACCKSMFYDRGEPVLSTFFLTDRFIHDSFIHEKSCFFQKSILSTFGNFAQNTVLSTFFANETSTRSFRQINHSSL